jgi:hypothetical protein
MMQLPIPLFSHWSIPLTFVLLKGTVQCTIARQGGYEWWYQSPGLAFVDNSINFVGYIFFYIGRPMIQAHHMKSSEQLKTVFESKKGQGPPKI